METKHKKDWLGDIVITSFIASFVIIMIGGMFDQSWMLGLGLLALIPMVIFFIGAIFLRFCTMLIDLIDIIRKR